MCTGTADLAIEAATSPRRRARRWSASISPARCCASARAKCARAALDGAHPSGARRRDARCRCPTRRSTRRRSRSASATSLDPVARVPRSSAACCGRAAGSRFSSSARRRCPGSAGLRLVFPARPAARSAGCVSRHGDAYAYLPASVAEFPSGERFADLLRAAGFRTVRHSPLTLGIVWLYVARDTAASPNSRDGADALRASSGRSTLPGRLTLTAERPGRRADILSEDRRLHVSSILRTIGRTRPRRARRRTLARTRV